MTDFETATLTAQYAAAIAQVLIGLGQIGIVYYGISRMVQANDSRAELQRDLMQRQERESERRHAEIMAGVETQRQTLDMQRQALETLIARTSASGTA